MKKCTTRAIYKIAPLRGYPFLLTSFLCTLIGFINVDAQNVSFNNTAPVEMTVCGSSELFYIQFTNISGGVLSDANIIVDLPDGIEYVSGSISETSSSNVQEVNISDLSLVTFSMSDLAAAGAVTFSIETIASFGAYTEQNNGSTFTNNVTVSYVGGSDDDDSDAYNILYAALSITTVSPMAATVSSGSSYQRTVTIVNGGYGALSTFVLKDEYDANLDLIASDLGTINGAGDEITFSSADFTSIGDGDGFFEQNESIVVTETIMAVGCSSAQSQLTALWGCGGSTTASNIKTPYSTVVSNEPNLAYVATPSFNTCMDGSFDAQQLEITNNGSGVASGLVVEISPKHQAQYTESLVNTIEYTLNSTSTSLFPTATDNATGYSCLTASAIDGFTVNLPDLQPGETIYLDWDNFTCATTYCGDVRYMGWNYDVSYENACATNSYTDDGTGQSATRKKFSTLYEAPTDIVGGEIITYSLIVSSATFTLPEGTSPYLEVTFDIPIGLTWSGTSSDLSYTSSTTTWTANQINYDAGTRKLTGQYLLPLPSGFKLNGSTFDVNLTADCTNGSNAITVGMQLFYIMDASCATSSKIPLTCIDNAESQLHCPGSCSGSEGMEFQKFSIARTNFGQSDNNLDGLPDEVDNLDFDQIKLNRVMVSDTFKTTFEGKVHTSGTFPSWSYGYASSDLPYGSELDYLSATVTVYDNSTGQTLVCSSVSYTENVVNDTMTVNFDFSPGQLNSNGCSVFSGFVFEQDDSVSIEANYKVVGNIGGGSELAVVTNEFYLSNTANGTPYQCDTWKGNFTIIGYYFKVNSSEQYNITTCSRAIKQDFKMSIGPCCSNFNGGNIFPYEYRNWANIRNLRVTIPDGYTFESGYMEQWRTKSTGSSKKETVSSITPSSSTSTELTFDLEQHYIVNGGTINLSDDGFKGRVYLTMKPECEQVNEAGNFPMKWHFDFRENDVLGGSITSEYTSTADYLKYFQGDLDISSTLPTQDGTSESVSWDIEIECSNGEAANGFFYFENLAGDIVVTEVMDLSDNSILTPANNMYQIGNFEVGDTKDYRITATYSSCGTPELKVISGHSCNDYPESIAAYNCSTKDLTLYVSPQPAELQVRFDGAINSLDDCADLVEFEIEMLSAKLGAIYNLNVDVTIPSSHSMLLEGGSVEVLYPDGGSYESISDPVLTGDIYSITGAEMSSTIGTNGLVGVTDLAANLVKLKFNMTLESNFKPGEFLLVQISGNEACGNPIDGLSLLYDPNAIFEEPTGIGLDDSTDDWTMAWGDYNSDGFVDLFVSNYNDTQANSLYKNDGDGSFTKVTTGDIVTDLATSIGASWGDYDNDGDLDLFVANHIGYQNFLYRNNGDETFTKVINDPIVTDIDYGMGAAWADYDNDGYLDMFVSDYFSTKFNKLFHNNGDGTFTEDNSAEPALETGFSISGVWGDYNNDGLLDLFVANSYNTNNSLYKNLGNRSFEKITTGNIVTDGGTSTGGSWGDYNNDGYLDLFVSNGGDQVNFLYRNNGDETFTKITTGNIVTDTGQSHGSAWADYDNDGDLDLFVSNDQGQNNFIYANDGEGNFTKVTNAISQDGGKSFGAGWADIDNDGDLDLYVANRDESDNFIYTNTRGKCQSNMCIVLEGTNSNRSGIGAKIHVKANIYGVDTWQMKEVSSQTGGGIGGQNELKQIFGLGDATIADSIRIEWPSGIEQVLTNEPLGACLDILETDGSEICGKVYFDENGNCTWDSTELVIPDREILITPGNHMIKTDENGDYSIFLLPDTYTVTQGTSTVWNESCTTEHFVTVVGNNNQYCNNNFANTTVSQMPDLEVNITAAPQRIGFKNLVAISFTNIGTQPATNTILDMSFDPEIIAIESSIPWSTSGDSNLTWNFGTIDVRESVTIFFKDSIAATTAIGELLNFSVFISCDETEIDESNNSASIAPLAVGGFDPNDILVTPEGYIDEDQELTYTIRFQNVGNIPASRIRVENQLHDNLDLETFQMGIASHNYRLDIEDNKLIWTFENINLPDSTSNEAESHGYIVYKIIPKQSLEDGDIVLNKAQIYFDNNLPIHTNVVYNTIGEEPRIVFAENGKLQVYPNPSLGRASFKITSEDQQIIDIKSLSIYDVTGKLILRKESLLEPKLIIEEGLLPPGFYEVEARGEDNLNYIGRLIIQ